MNNILTIKNVRAYIDENGTAQLNLEDCARGLGFTQIKNSVEYVKWERVISYIEEFGFSPLVGKDAFIPENIFYRLAMKAGNKTAEKFQTIVCDEILPQIRKTGSYNLPKMSQQEILIATLKEQQKIVERVDLVEQKLDNQMTIDHAQQRKLQKEIAIRVYARLKENYLSDYKEDFDKEKRKLFSQLHREIKDRFAVSSYADVRIKDFSSCLNYIKNWIERKD